MKKNVKKRRKFPVIIGVVVLVLIVLGILKLTNTTPLFNKTASRTSKNTKGSSITKAGRSPAPAADNAPNNERKSSSNPASTLENSGSPTTNASFSVNINSAGLFVVQNTSYLHVAASVSNATSGTCTLTVSQSGQSDVTQSDSIELQNSQYVCAPFNIPVGNFPNKGDWDVSVSVTSNGATASADWSNNPVSLS